MSVPTSVIGQSLPIWQTYPLHPGTGGPDSGGNLITCYDFQQVSEISDLFKISNSTLRPSIGFIRLPDTRPGKADRVVVDNQVVQPIIENGKVVGMLWFRLPWLEFFTDFAIDDS
eukprot:scaffold2241_cov135-Cylindrotheca_fusiformis.AAC.1